MPKKTTKKVAKKATKKATKKVASKKNAKKAVKKTTKKTVKKAAKKASRKTKKEIIITEEDIGYAAFLNFMSRVENGYYGDEKGDWLAAELDLKSKK